MNRVRVSTTIDGDRLSRARELTSVRDSELFDLAIDALLQALIARRETEAIGRFPYHADPELHMGRGAGDADNELDYTGGVPPEVRALAKKRSVARALTSAS